MLVKILSCEICQNFVRFCLQSRMVVFFLMTCEKSFCLLLHPNKMHHFFIAIFKFCAVLRVMDTQLVCA